MTQLFVGIVLLALGWVARWYYDLKIQPKIKEAHRRAEQQEKEDEEKRTLARRNRLDGLNASWKQGREALRLAQAMLGEFNQMNRFPDRYSASKCAELAAQTEAAAKELDDSRYADIKKKLLEYAARRDQINVNTPLRELTRIFQRMAGEIYEPLALKREIDDVLEKTRIPPFSEADIQ